MTKTKQSEHEEANLSNIQMRSCIPKIERRIADLKAFDTNSITDSDHPAINALQHQLDALLVNVFGANTVEYNRYVGDVTGLDKTSYSYVDDTSTQEIRLGFSMGIATSIASLEAIKNGFVEELEDAGMTSATKALKAYEGLELHPEVERAVGSLYRDGHYANAVEDATKTLNALVRMRSGLDDLDGTTLMETVFSPKNPILRFNELADASDRDEQKGFMMMLSGAVAGLRNPRAHKIIKDDPEMALEFIAYVSLLAKLVDKSSRSS